MLPMIPLTPQTLPKEELYGIYVEVIYISEIGLLGSYMAMVSYKRKILRKSKFSHEGRARYYYDFFKVEMEYVFSRSFLSLPLLLSDGSSLRNELVKIRLEEGR